MPPWLHFSPYKGLFILVLIFVLLEYFFNTFSESKTALFNTIRFSNTDKEPQIYGPIYRSLLLKNNKTHSSTISNGTTKFNDSYFGYIITEPPFINLNGTSSTATALEISTIEAENATSKMLNTTGLPFCPDDISANLKGRVPVVLTPVPTVQQLEKKFSWLKPGGHWKPENCKILKRVAIVIPFRCRGEHLLLFLQHMHPFLKRQMLDYTIYILEQDLDGPFNRAMLMNIGFKEALKDDNFDCFVFHDIDLLPEDDRNLYTCPEQPRHMSVAVDIFNYRLPYSAIFGGVSAITREHFQLLNGFSNAFWGWGGEDDDMSNRIRYHHLHISRYPLTIARYSMLTHKKDKPNPSRYDLLKQGQKRFDKDGLNSLSYQLVVKKKNLLYTWVLVRIEPPKS